MNTVSLNKHVKITINVLKVPMHVNLFIGVLVRCRGMHVMKISLIPVRRMRHQALNLTGIGMALLKLTPLKIRNKYISNKRDTLTNHLQFAVCQMLSGICKNRRPQNFTCNLIWVFRSV